MNALRTRLGVTNIAPTLWEVLYVAVALAIDLVPIRKLAKVRKIVLFAVSPSYSHK